MINKFKPILAIFPAAILGYGIHKLIAYFILAGVDSTFYYPLEFLYSMFCLLSVIIVSILVVVKERSINSTGYAFLLLTCAKMAVAYVALRPVLQLQSDSIAPEKLHFFAVFAFFLSVETLISVRILNK